MSSPFWHWIFQVSACMPTRSWSNQMVPNGRIGCSTMSLRIARLWKTTRWQEVNVHLRKGNFISTSTDIAFKSIKALKSIKKKLRTTNFYNYDRCDDADSCCDFSRPWIFACRIAAKSEPCRLDKILDIFRIAICLPEWDFDDVIGDAVLYSCVLLKLIL